MTQIVFKQNLTPKLSTKGKILVAIPLTVQIISVLVMSFMIWTAEQESTNLDQARDITSESLMVAKLIYDADLDLYFCVEAMQKTGVLYPSYLQSYRLKTETMKAHLSLLWKMAVGRPKEKNLIKEMIVTSKNILVINDQMVEKLKNRDLQNTLAIAVVLTDTETYMGKMSRIIAQLVEMEQKDKETNRGMELRHQAQWFLFTSVLLNIIVVLALLQQFNRGTIARLAVLMDNTKRLASHQPLNPALQGGDEIGELDRVFHEAADAMEAAKKRENELMDLKKQIMAMVSHDLRAPLSSLQITLDMLQRNMLGQLPDAAHDKVVASEQSVARLIRMINDLLDVEKLEAGMMEIELRDLPLQVIVERSVDAMDELAKSKGLRITHPDTEFEVRGDGDRLIQVLVNFLSNAVKFAPEGSEIKIDCKKIDDMVEVRVSDRGPGIPEDYRTQIFERYRQVKGEKSKSGTGLGLAICKLVVEMHGGKIGVDPAEGGGSSFFFTIPAAQDMIDDEDEALA